MKKFFVSLLLLSVIGINDAAAQQMQYTVTDNDIHRGYISKRIPLNAFSVPEVRLLNPVYKSIAATTDSISGDVHNIYTVIGAERKQPFAVVRIPAYSRDANGQLQALTSYTLDVVETAAATQPAAAKGTAANSVLANGTWYKIAVPARGVYKVDYNFLQSKLGISGSIDAANIRLFGNGGVMLFEDNKISRPSDLTENAITVNDGGDGTFNGSDYFLFYANGPMGWTADTANERFVHRKNLYADSSFYFITVDQGPGLRVASQPGTPVGNVTVTEYNDYNVHESDLFNPGKFGKSWLGEKFGPLVTTGNSGSFSFNVGSVAGNIKIKAALAGRSLVAGSYFNIGLNGVNTPSGSFSGVTMQDDKDPYSARTMDFEAPSIGSTATVNVTYVPTANDGTGYLDYLELNYRRALNMDNPVVAFRDLRSYGNGKVARYQIGNASGNMEVWDITNPLQPVRMNGTLSGGTYSFSQDATTIHEFVAMNGSGFSTPEFREKVANQNIHGAEAPQLIIVTPEKFLTAANDLAEHHRTRDKMRVLVAATNQVYNEFSSGGQDITAIRDMARWFYVKAGSDTSSMPENILLFGDASYDYKDRIAGNSNYVPTYQSDESISVGNSYVIDEYYCMLDDNEDIRDLKIPNTLDIGVGRLPVTTIEQANAMVKKIVGYTSPAALGPWRLNNTYLGDNEDNAGAHLQDAEHMIDVVARQTGNLYNNTKIYLDNLPFVSTPGGARCPEGNDAINNNIFRGTFMLNYTGHGSIYTLTHERVLTAVDIAKWKNTNKLPFMLTATCDFSRYDRPETESAGEQIVNKGNGGAIAILTTTAAVYASYNKLINEEFLDIAYHQFNTSDASNFGKAFRMSKNEIYLKYVGENMSGIILNARAFVLLGDPAVRPSFPEHLIETDSIVDVAEGRATDTFKALGNYTINGSVKDKNGTVLSGFNGRAYVSIYDKARNVSVDTRPSEYYSPVKVNFKMQDNIIYKGIATVKDGHFSVSFIAPKDLNYDFGVGRISYYAENGTTDAAGVDSGKSVGGFSDNPVVDNAGPIVKPYMNDTLFRDGAITGNNTALYVRLYDETGINVSGNAVGHDLTAVLDDNLGNPYNLNDYYQADANTYKSGTVNFPVNGLANGRHTFTVKAWDVNNNSGTGKVNFMVADGKVVTVQNLMNYPNPFSDITHFVFEHNHPNETYKVQIAIYSMEGRLVKMLDQSFTPSGSHSNELTWDGTDSNGGKISAGVYPYKMVLTTEKGIQETAYQKLVFIRY